MIPIQDIINKTLKEKNKREKKEITSWHISRLGSCLRGVYYERLGVKPDTEIDDRTLRVFDIGNKIEDWVVEQLTLNPNIKVETQIRVEDKDLNVSGYADLKLGVNGDTELYEIKSKHSKSFWWMEKKGEGAHRHHQYQLWLYLWLTKISKGSLVYVSKDDMTILQYPVLRDNKALYNEVMKELELLNKAWKKKDPSILPLYDDKDWRSKFCRYHSHCKDNKE